MGIEGEVCLGPSDVTGQNQPVFIYACHIFTLQDSRGRLRQKSHQGTVEAFGLFYV